MLDTIRIATRKSPLAMWQAEFVKASLQKVHSGLNVEIIGMTTQGDEMLESRLLALGGKSLFIKELEVAMLEGRADIAVHSMKDVPVTLPEGLEISCILKRADPFDALVSRNGHSLKDLPEGACLGTSSLRRETQLKHFRPDFKIKDLRGNVNTRLKKLDNGEFDAIILAVSGLERLALSDRISEKISSDIVLPAVGQGALGIECLENASDIHSLLKPLHDEVTADCLRAERAMNRRLDGRCYAPVAAFAEIDQGECALKGLVGSLDGSQILFAQDRAPKNACEQLGIRVAEDLISQGAMEILDALPRT